MSYYTVYYTRAKQWFDERIGETPSSTAYPIVLTQATSYASTIIARLGELEALYNSRSDEYAKIKKTYQQTYWDSEIEKVKAKYQVQFQAILDSLGSNILRIGADLLKYIGEKETQPITAEINAQLDALEKIDLLQADIDLYSKEFEGVPLAMKRLEKIAENKDLELKLGDYEDKYIAAWKVAQQLYEPYGYAKDFYGQNVTEDTLRWALKINGSHLVEGVTEAVEKLRNLTQNNNNN